MPVTRIQGARTVLLVVIAFAASALGLTTYDSELSLALVFPSTGVGIIWLATSTHRTVGYDAVLLTASTLAGGLVVGLPFDAATMLALVAVSNALAWYAVEYRLAHGHVRLESLRNLSIFLAACVVGAIVSGGLRFLGLGLLPVPSLSDAALAALRNLSWSLGLGGAGVLLLPHLASLHSIAGALARARSRALYALEGLTALLATVVMLWLMFSDTPRALGFGLMLVVVWAALRTSPLVAVSGALVIGTVALVATLNGMSPFATSAGELESAVIAQAFMVSLVLVALVVAIETRERRESTERAGESERDATARAALLAAVLEHLSEGVSVITDDDHYSVRNPAALRLTGRDGFLYTGDAELDQPVLVDDAGRRLRVEEMPHARALASGEAVVREVVRARTGRGEERFLEISSTPVLGEGAAALVVNTIRDITREREDRDQLVSFAGVVAHDLKNPLAVISGWSESLHDELADDRDLDVATLRGMVERVQSSSAQMRSFIDDLLSMTVAQDRPLDLRHLDLTGLAEEVAEQRRSGEARPHIEVQPDMWVTADRFLTRQLVDNLVGNAIKYVGEGVRPTMEVTARDCDGYLEVAVTDNGIGIPVEARHRVFDSFVRAHVNGYSGTGLGLAICQRVVTRHGGQIWVADHDGPGTQVRFTLPRL